MKRIINGKSYNTDTATLIAETDNGLSHSDFKVIEEDLYKTKKGQYFISYFGGAATCYAVRNGQWASEGRGIKLLSDTEAMRFLESNDEVNALEKYFASEIEEG